MKPETKLQPLPAAGGMFHCDGHLSYLTINKQSENKRFCKDCLGIIEEAESYGNAKDYWDETGQKFYCGGKWFGLDDNLRTICIAIEDVPESVKDTVVPKKVPTSECSSLKCSAPICPLDKSSLKNGIWYPDESVCNRRGGRPVWVEIQKRIAKKAKDKTRYFTYNDFQRKRVANPRGHNADLKLA